MGRAPSDAPDPYGARELRLPRFGDVVLTHLPGSPAGDVQEFVIHGEVDVGHKRRHGAKTLQQRRQRLLRRRLWRNGRCFLSVELAVFAPPRPNGAFEIGRVDHDTQKTIFADRIMRRADLERHLVIGPEIDRLHIATGAIPEVEMVAVFVREQVFRDGTVLELRRQPPFAGSGA
jgi:hypothetical protein